MVVKVAHGILSGGVVTVGPGAVRLKGSEGVGKTRPNSSSP